MAAEILDIIGSRPLLMDGAMGSTIQDRDLEIDRDYLGHENCVDLLVREPTRTHPGDPRVFS